MKEFHRRDFANRTGLAQAWTVKSADRLFTFFPLWPVHLGAWPGGSWLPWRAAPLFVVFLFLFCF